METVLITGASRGIGLELTKQFIELGYKVIATYRGKQTDELINLSSHNNLQAYELEVTNEDSISRLSNKLNNITIDILINNAGVIGPDNQKLETIEVDCWLNTFAVNTIAPLLVSRSLLGNLKLSNKPRIITISSQMASLKGEGTGMYAYRSSKAAVNKVMQVMSLELKEFGVAVYLIHPGWVKTDMGGSEADVSVQDSASGIVTLAKNLSLDQTGEFLDWEGNHVDW